jgi:hypothetical protein
MHDEEMVNLALREFAARHRRVAALESYVRERGIRDAPTPGGARRGIGRLSRDQGAPRGAVITLR